MSAEETPSTSIIKAQNGVTFVMPAKVADEIAAEPEMQSNLERMAERIARVKGELGFKGDFPVQVLDDAEPYNFSALPYSLKENRVTLMEDGVPLSEQAAQTLWPDVKGADEVAPVLSFTSGSLVNMLNPRYNDEELHGVIAHEIGHIMLQENQIVKEASVSLDSRLKYLELASNVIIGLNVEQVDAPIPDSAAFLTEGKALSEASGLSVEKLLSFAKAENGNYYSETLIDNMQGENRLSVLQAAAQVEDCRNQINNLFERHSTLLDAVRKIPMPDGVLSAQPSQAAIHSDFLNGVASRANEIMADDVAARWNASSFQDLANTMHRETGKSGFFDDKGHPSGVNRFTRAVVLDEARAQHTVDGIVDETAATQQANQTMREIKDATQNTLTELVTYDAEKGGNQPNRAIMRVEWAGVSIAESKRSYTDRIKAEKAAKPPAGNAR